MWGGLPDLRRTARRYALGTIGAPAEPRSLSPDEAFDLALADILTLRLLWTARHAGVRLSVDGPSFVTLRELGLLT
jgi:hypothetical protein